MRLRSFVAAAAAAALALTACSNSTEEETGDATDRSHDLSGVTAVEEIAALVPAEIRERGTLVVGMSPDYAPAEFRAEDLQTPIGYDVDLSKALGQVLDLNAQISPAEFASILPGIGTKSDVGISSFTINDERTASYNMVAYINVGSSFAVKAGNPEDFDPAAICGVSIGVQSGTVQLDQLEVASEECTQAGEDPVDIVVYSTQSDVTTNVVGGKITAMFADSTVSGYAAALTGGQMEVIGDVVDSEPQGIVVSQSDQALTDAVQQAMQHLMDDGTWDAILASWGIEDAALSDAAVYPQN